MIPAVQIVGGGPAGTFAAISALLHGAQVELFEKSTFPRHKVCGEFLSPEVQTVFEKLDIWRQFLSKRPARIRRMELRIGPAVKRWALPEPAYGLSRFSLDKMLLDVAAERGARIIKRSHRSSTGPLILAAGRQASAPKGHRIFGFKAHFSGPAEDCVSLCFFPGGYIGIGPIENNATNVCGLAREDTLAAVRFDIDSFVNNIPYVKDRLTPMTRTTRWLVTGPLIMSTSLRKPGHDLIYPAGDALSFIDPFTGSGMASAILTGSLAGAAAARGRSVESYFSECRKSLSQPFELAHLFRRVLERGWADRVARFIPASVLFRMTRIHPFAI